MGELGVLSLEFAQRIVLNHECIQIDWDLVYANLQHLDDLAHFRDAVRRWLAR